MASYSMQNHNHSRRHMEFHAILAGAGYNIYREGNQLEDYLANLHLIEQKEKIQCICKFTQRRKENPQFRQVSVPNTKAQNEN